MFVPLMPFPSPTVLQDFMVYPAFRYALNSVTPNDRPERIGAVGKSSENPDARLHVSMRSVNSTLLSLTSRLMNPLRCRATVSHIFASRPRN